MSNPPANREVVIVTGSSGYIGSAMVEALAGTYRVLGFDRETAPSRRRTLSASASI